MRAIPFFGRSYRVRPVEEALFRALIPPRIFWVSQGTITTFCKDEEVLDLAAKSGCLALLIGFESISADSILTPYPGTRLRKTFVDEGRCSASTRRSRQRRCSTAPSRRSTT